MLKKKVIIKNIKQLSILYGLYYLERKSKNYKWGWGMGVLMLK